MTTVLLLATTILAFLESKLSRRAEK